MKIQFSFLSILLLATIPARIFDTTAATIPFSQNWTNAALITVDDDWSGVPSIMGYRGDGMATTGQDPQTVVADGSGTPVDVIANQTNPNTNTTGGVAEFAITNPTIALQGSTTADAPHIVINLNTTNYNFIQLSYNVRDIDGSADDADQEVALQYRVGNSGNYTNIPAGFVGDATTQNSTTQVTPISVVLPAGANNQALVQIRIITVNAPSNDEWVGIDDISITAFVLPVHFGSLKALQQGNGIRIEWSNLTEAGVISYDVERSANGRSFIPVGTINARSNDGARADYDFLDVQPLSGINYYRIRSSELDGQNKYSIIVKVDNGGGAAEISVYPNPVTGKQFSLQASNLPKGQYTVRVYNQAGQQVYSRLLLHNGGSVAEEIRLEGSTPGVYSIQLNSRETIMVKRFILQ